MDLVNYIIEFSTEYISKGGPFFGFLLVFSECFFPMLPLSVFVTLNVNAFGLVGGCLISWMATCLGSFICYLLFRYLESKISEKFLNKKLVKKIVKATDKFKKVKFTELVLIITLPFTPSFLVNILCGITRMKKEKFICSLLVGKAFSISFWGYIGKTFIDSITDLHSIIYILVALGIAYIVSKVISKKMNIN